MIKTKNLLASLSLEIPALEVDQEGKLRGGFCAFSAVSVASEAYNQDCNCNCRCRKRKKGNKKYNKKDNCDCNCGCVVNSNQIMAVQGNPFEDEY